MSPIPNTTGEKTTTVNNLYANGSDFINLKIKTVKFEFYERMTNSVANGISAAIVATFGLFALLFISVAVSFWLSQIFDSYVIGFMTIGILYIIVTALYFFISRKKENEKLKNLILHKVSGNMNDFNLMLETKRRAESELEASAIRLSNDFNEVKISFNKLMDDFNRLKSQFSGGDATEAGGSVPRVIITSAIDFLLNTFVLKNAGVLKKAIFPVITKALVNSAILKKEKKSPLLEKIRLKIARLF